MSCAEKLFHVIQSIWENRIACSRNSCCFLQLRLHLPCVTISICKSFSYIYSCIDFLSFLVYFDDGDVLLKCVLLHQYMFPALVLPAATIFISSADFLGVMNMNMFLKSLKFNFFRYSDPEILFLGYSSPSLY